MKKFSAILLSSAFALSAAAQTPVWLEADSAAAIKSRLLSDFSLTLPQARDAINKLYGKNLTDDDVRAIANKHYIELKTIDGVERVHRKSPRNMSLLDPELNGGWKLRGASASPKRIAYVDSVLAAYDGTNPAGLSHDVTYRFTIDVPYDDALKDDTLTVWMPLPITSARQKNVKVLYTVPATHQVSSPDRSFHSTISMSQPVVQGQPTHFEAVVSFTTSGQYFSPEFILENIRPYDHKSDVYRRYTTPEAPHIVLSDGIRALAHEIVGNETNPYKQSELVYDYIINRYPWAGAREYSTIECIPEYVLNEKHGDCGQVSLLYISLMRSLGVPARWESGWMLHPGEKNLHDWAEVYFEGVGWVPVDVSFGRYIHAKDPRAQKFYSTGMDAHRLASNLGVCGRFDPQKRFVRSETVDAQLGEVESTRGNLFYPGWNQNLELISVRPVGTAPANVGTLVNDAIASVKKEYANDKRQIIYDVTPQYGPDSTVAISGSISDAAVKAHLFDALEKKGVRAADYVRLYPDTLWATPRISVAMLRTGPAHAAEMATQAIMGQPLRVIEELDGWTRVQTPDGYLAYVTNGSLARKTDAEMQAWRKAPRVVVTNPYQTRAYTTATAKGLRDVVTDLLNGNILELTGAKPRNGRTEIKLPDGRTGWVPSADITPIEKWAAQNFDADVILDQAYSLEGNPYFWGGTSVKHVDCSGLAKVSYLANGIILMRDASQQALTGQRIEAKDWRTCQPGDLLFFGNAKTGKVTHVAIYDNNGNYVHSSGRVKRNSVDPESPDYLTTPFLHAVRINGRIGTPGITYARNHPWYFNVAQ